VTGKTKSILLQVAFKGAVETGVVNEEQVIAYYELLMALHERYGIDPDETRNSGGSRKPTTPKAEQPQGETFILDGEMFTDFRAVKADPTAGLNRNYPDFKRVSDNKAFWVYTQDGEKVADTVPLVEARDQAIY